MGHWGWRRSERTEHGGRGGNTDGEGEDDGEGVVQVLAQRLGILPRLSATVDGAVVGFKLQGVGVDIQLVGTQATGGMLLAGEVECQGACGEVGGWTEGLVDEALAAGETCRGGAEGAGAPVQDLRDVAVMVSAQGGWPVLQRGMGYRRSRD